MRVDKAILRWQTPAGEVISWLEHARQRLLSICPQVVISGHPVAGELPDAQLGKLGPLSGIAAALEQFPERRCLILPVDMPWVPAAELLRLSRLSVRHGYFAQSQFPLLITSDPESRSIVRHLLWHADPRQRSVRRLLAQLPTAEVVSLQPIDPEELRNFNQPADLDSHLLTLNRTLLEHAL